MPRPKTTTYLDVTVGAFRLALRTGCVTAVTQDHSLDDPPVSGGGVLIGEVALRDDRVPLIRFSPATQESWEPGRLIPFVVTVDTDSGPVALAVDQVGYVHGAGTTRLAIPKFGILRSELFEGAVRNAGELLLLLDPAALARLATSGSEDNLTGCRDGNIR